MYVMNEMFHIRGKQLKYRKELLLNQYKKLLQVQSCTRLRILLNTICRKPGINSLRTPLNHGAEQASNETLKQTQQRN